MKIEDKLNFIQENHLSEWIKIRQQVSEEITINTSSFHANIHKQAGLRQGWNTCLIQIKAMLNEKEKS